MMVFLLGCSWSYIFIHYALLVAYVARSSDILTNFLGIPLYEFQLFCYCFSVIETDESIFSVFLTCSLEFCIPLYELCPFTGFSFKGRGDPFMLIAFFFFFPSEWETFHWMNCALSFTGYELTSIEIWDTSFCYGSSLCLSLSIFANCVAINYYQWYFDESWMHQLNLLLIITMCTRLTTSPEN